MATPEGLRQPIAAHLGEALRWMVAHSQGGGDALTPGPLELAELLWLASRLPEPPTRRRSPPTAFQPPPNSVDPHPAPPPPPADLKDALRQDKTPLPPDPFLPSPFPGAPAESAPQEEPLLPVAVLPDDQDVARNLEGMVLPGRVREEEPLGDRDKLLRALAPLLQRRPDRRRQRFEEERTVEVYAQTRLLQPMFSPCQGPSFDEVLLLLDGGLSMQVWRRQAEELRRVLASTQVFPQVRLQVLQPEPVQSGRDSAAAREAVERLCRTARPLPGAGSLLVLISDTAGRHWWDGRMFAALEQWGRACPTAILHPLPMWHWARTALAAVQRVSLRNGHPAATNPAYQADPLNWWDPPLPRDRNLAIPVLPLDRDALDTWSAVVLGYSGYASPGVALRSAAQRQNRLRELLGDRELSAPSPSPPPLTEAEARARWESFQAMASPQAQKLLVVLASSPLLTLPVIDLLKAAMLPEVAGALPIAEVLTSGFLVRRAPRNGSTTKSLPPEKIQFELQPAVADLLRDQLPPVERRDVISRVTALVERRWNRQIGEPSFDAVLCDPHVSPPEGLEGVVQFASVTARLLDSLPGDAARAFAERIRRGSGLPPGSPWPAAMVFEEVGFEAVQLWSTPGLEAIACLAARFEELELRPISFGTAMVKADGSVQASGGSGWGFHEPLQREGLPFAATAERADPLALTLVQLPAGRFLMGSPPDEPERFDDEGPQHEVELESFLISQTPITQAQWREVAGWQPLEGERWGRELEPNPSRFQNRDGEGQARLLAGETSTDDRPVEQVSWEEAMEFCNRLSQRTGRTYTLPSEAQWEYACRAGTSTPFHFGGTMTTELANYNGEYTYANGPKGEYREQTTPVGMFPSNAWGLQDMHGNVLEWCQDHWHETYEGAPIDGSAWLDDEGPTAAEDSEKRRLLRGGSWNGLPGLCRSACRFHSLPGYARSYVGFRVVCLPQGPSLNP